MPQLLMFLKADALLREAVGRRIVSEMLENDALKFESFQRIAVDGELIAEHYAHVKARAFYPWLVDYITISPVLASIITVDRDGVESLREQLGSTISQNATPGTVRHTYGIYGGINCLHVSDSVESGEREVGIWEKDAGLKRGVFDIEPEVFARAASGLNNTAQLRRVCAEIDAARAASTENVSAVVELLRAECPEASETELYRLAEVVIVSGLR